MCAKQLRNLSGLVRLALHHNPDCRNIQNVDLKLLASCQEVEDIYICAVCEHEYVQTSVLVCFSFVPLMVNLWIF